MNAAYFTESQTEMLGNSCHCISSTKHEKCDNGDIFVSLESVCQLSGKYGTTRLKALGSKFLKHFPSMVMKCWHWPGGQFWNPVALVQTNSACSLELFCTQTINITPMLQISHLFIYSNKFKMYIWTESAFGHIANFHHSL